MTIKILPYQLKEQINHIKGNYFAPSLETLKGNVLEIGFGKGENFKYYNNECSVYAVDKQVKYTPNQATRCKLNIQEATVEQLQFENDFFDAVVGSFVWCSVSSVESTLAEINRVLKKDGQLIFIEHIESNDTFTRILQKAINLLQRLLSKDCHLDRDPRQFLQKNKFHIIKEKVFTNSLEPYLYLEAVKC